MNKKFCCEKLSYYDSGENTMGLNIRILMYKGIIREKMLLLNPKANDKGFVITSGYKDSVNDKETMRMVIDYCPFCGQKLSDFYKSDDYIQEVIE